MKKPQTPRTIRVLPSKRPPLAKRAQPTVESELAASPSIIKLLNEILDHQVANRGGQNPFYTCYTYGYDANGIARMPPWVEKAENILKTLKTNAQP